MDFRKLRLIDEAIDEALALFERSVREVVFHYCEAKFNVRRNKVTLLS